MDTPALIDRLNNDLADEHAAVIRYLIHGWMEGEDTPLGSSLISIAREEMWHMHWLGMVIGDLGGEPTLLPNPYPHDPSSRATLLQSYIDYEEKLVPHYNGEADMVDDAHIARVLRREAWESAIHAKKFARKLGKLSPEDQNGAPGGETGELPAALLETLQTEVADTYTRMLQHLRMAWRFQTAERTGWRVMDQSMEMMKQLAHFAEDVAEDGVEPRFTVGTVDRSVDLGAALRQAVEDVRAARERHLGLQSDPEVGKHSGLVINLDLTVRQEAYEAEELADWRG